MGPGSQAAPSAGAPPRRTDSHWLDTVVSGSAVARQEEAFFWPKNNTRVSPGTSLLHPLPSIVSHHTIPGRLALHSLEGGAARSVSKACDTSGSASTSRLGQASGSSRWTDHACASGHRVPGPGKGLPAETTGWMTLLLPLPHCSSQVRAGKGLAGPSAHHPITQTRKLRPRKVKVLPNF